MTDSPVGTTESSAEPPSFESGLKEGRDRFLAHAIEHALSSGRRSPEDFLRFFPPSTIMKGLADSPGLRAQILVEAIEKSLEKEKSARFQTMEEFSHALLPLATADSAQLERPVPLGKGITPVPPPASRRVGIPGPAARVILRGGSGAVKVTLSAPGSCQ